MSTAFAIANEIVGIIDSEDFRAYTAQEFTASVQVLPRYERSELERLTITVVPITEALEPTARNSYSLDCEIEIGIQKKASKSELQAAGMQPLAEFTHILTRYLAEQIYTSGKRLEVSTSTVYSMDSLTDEMVYTAVISTKFKTFFQFGQLIKLNEGNNNGMD